MYKTNTMFDREDNPWTPSTAPYQEPLLGQGAMESAAGIKEPAMAGASGAGEAATGGAASGGLAAGAATANPWVMGGMAAMGALSAGLERKRKEREMEYQSVVDKLNAQSKAVGNAQQFASRISY